MLGQIYKSEKDYGSSRVCGKTQKICFDFMKLEKSIRYPVEVLSWQLEMSPEFWQSSSLQGASLSWQDMDVIPCNILLTPFIKLSNDKMNEYFFIRRAKNTNSAS